jgi:hypothetical protein
MEYFIIFIFLVIGWITAVGDKTGMVRLLDVFIFGPVLIYIGHQNKILWQRIILYIFGASTISYNLRNFIISQYP